MYLGSLKYLLVYTLPISVIFSFNSRGWLTFMPLFIYFGLLPLIELILKPDARNLEKEVASVVKNQKIYDYILYLSVPVQLGLLMYFFNIIQFEEYGTTSYFGKVTAMGLMCGVLGINVGHELGHRNKRWEQFLGEILLLTSLDSHFLPYHNAGHHFRVATPEDASTAKKNQTVFSFWITSHFGSYIEAWKLEYNRLNSKGKNWLSFNNRMVAYTFINLVLLLLIHYLFSWYVLMSFILASIFGIVLLETVNYIEHYGLMRKKTTSGRYERVKHEHSWNSDHPLGRAMLFNLSRHSDHHYNGSKKYQVLKSLPESPKMPTGYPGMMLLALIPPLWFYVMNKKIEKIES